MSARQPRISARSRTAAVAVAIGAAVPAAYATFYALEYYVQAGRVESTTPPEESAAESGSTSSDTQQSATADEQHHQVEDGHPATVAPLPLLPALEFPAPIQEVTASAPPAAAVVTPAASDHVGEALTALAAPPAMPPMLVVAQLVPASVAPPRADEAAPAVLVTDLGAASVASPSPLDRVGEPLIASDPGVDVAGVDVDETEMDRVIETRL